jgi:putative NADH-flavin reductase
MKISIFGASGKTGILTVFQALNQGHEVTAFTRQASKVTIQHPKIHIIQGDVLDYEKVKQAVTGQDVVICTLGVNKNKPNTILSDGTRNILNAMEEDRVKRFICMSSAGILGNDSGFWFGKIFMPLFLRHIFNDKIRQMKVVQESKAEWVLIRPVGLTDAPKTGKYKITLGIPSSSTIPRADVADFMLKLMTDKQYDRQIPAISSY